MKKRGNRKDLPLSREKLTLNIKNTPNKIWLKGG
jgi:hypothetical protein